MIGRVQGEGRRPPVPENHPSVEKNTNNPKFAANHTATEDFHQPTKRTRRILDLKKNSQHREGNPSESGGSFLHMTTEPFSQEAAQQRVRPTNPSATLGSFHVTAEPSSRKFAAKGQMLNTLTRPTKLEATQRTEREIGRSRKPARALPESGPRHPRVLQRNKKGRYKHTHRVQEKNIGVPRSLTTAEDAGRVEGSREQEKIEPHTRQPDPTHDTVQGLPPSSCRRSERSGLGISWNARQSRPTQHRSV